MCNWERVNWSFHLVLLNTCTSTKCLSSKWVVRLPEVHCFLKKSYLSKIIKKYTVYFKNVYYYHLNTFYIWYCINSTERSSNPVTSSQFPYQCPNEFTLYEPYWQLAKHYFRLLMHFIYTCSSPLWWIV